MVLVHETDRRTGSGHLVFRRLDNGAQRFEEKLKVCQRAAHIGQVTGSLAGGAKGSWQNGFPSTQKPVAGAERLPFLPGHSRIEAIEPQSRSGQVTLFPEEETKQGSAFLIFQSTFRGWLWPNVTLLFSQLCPSVVLQETVVERCRH